MVAAQGDARGAPDHRRGADEMTGARPIGRLVVTPRALADYRDMFMLTDDDLTGGPILDCPAGASPFGAQVRARGGSVISVDPVYALPPGDLMAVVREDIERAYTWAASQDASVDWSYLGSADAMRRAFELGADLFSMDYTSNRRWYVAARIAELPFSDRHFRLTVCSHLLFCYPQYLSYAEHVDGLLELVRVTAGEVRVYPLVDTTAVAYPRLDELRADLAGRGVDTEIRPAACAWQTGGDRLLACKRSG
jgi:hypothetical protein